MVPIVSLIGLVINQFLYGIGYKTADFPHYFVHSLISGLFAFITFSSGSGIIASLWFVLIAGIVAYLLGVWAYHFLSQFT